MQLNFLGRESLHLAKTYDVSPEGVITEQPYPLVKNFYSYHEDDIQDIHDLLFALKHHASAGNCFLNGTLTTPLRNESRAGRVDTQAQHHLAVFDIDGMIEPNMLPHFSPAVKALGIEDTSYIVQYSNSLGIKPNKGPSGHLFFILETPMSSYELRLWTLHHNLSTPMFVRHLNLTRAHNALKYALDPTSNEDNRIIYIASPILKGIKDPIEDRFVLVEGNKPTLSLDLTGLHNEKQLQALKKDHVNNLRTRQRLPPITVSTRSRQVGDETIEVAVNASPVQATGQKEERGFAYFNFNGGDSWGYYHPLESPDIIYNFKGEDNLLTREVLPGYYPKAKARAREYIEELRREEEKKLAEEAQIALDATIDQLNERTDHDADRPPIPFVFTDGDTGRYRGGVHNPADGTMELYNLGNLIQVEAFCTQHGIEVPGVIPTWKLTYDPTEITRFMRGRNQLNIYCPSKYRLAATPTCHTLPETIRALITHVLGDDQHFVDHFLNWLAFTFQTGRKPQTAFVLTGTTGTGKGTLQHQILSPLFGRSNVAVRTLDTFEDKFNDDLMACQILWIEESSTDSTSTPKKVAQKLLTLITDDSTTHRAMRRDFKNSQSYFAPIFSSNVINVTIVQANDRRFNVAPRQEISLRKRIGYDHELHGKLAAELQDFANFLMAFKVNEEEVRTPLWSDAKADMVESTTEVPADISMALKAGNFGYFVDQLPTDPSSVKDPAMLASSPALLAYIQVLDRVVEQHRLLAASGEDDSEIAILRDDVQTIFKYCAGWVNQTPTKFTKAVSKYGLTIRPLYFGKTEEGDDVIKRGLRFELHVSDAVLRHYLLHYSRLPKLRTVHPKRELQHPSSLEEEQQLRTDRTDISSVK